MNGWTVRQQNGDPLAAPEAEPQQKAGKAIGKAIIIRPAKRPGVGPIRRLFGAFSGELRYPRGQ